MKDYIKRLEAYLYDARNIPAELMIRWMEDRPDRFGKYYKISYEKGRGYMYDNQGGHTSYMMTIRTAQQIANYFGWEFVR